MQPKFLIIIAMFLSVMGRVQIVDGRDITADSTVGYLEIYSPDFFKNKLVVYINYGQEMKKDRMDTPVAGPDGKPVSFHSAMDAVNYFHYGGWELMSMHDTPVSAEASWTYYVMRRRGK